MSGGKKQHPTVGMGVTADRIEYIELLTGVALAPNEVVERLGDSRSTVTRALRELREADLVTKTDGAYTATAAGAMAAGAYREYEETSGAILSATRLLAPLDADVDLPGWVLRDATTYRAAERGPFATLEAVTDEVSAARTIRAYLPSVSNPHLLRVWHRQVTERGASVDVTVPVDVFGALQGRYPDLLGEMATGPLEVRRGDGPEYGIVVTESAEGEPAALTVLVYADNKSIHGALQTHRGDALRWAERKLDEIDAAAEVATDEMAALALQSDGDVPPTTGSPSSGDTREGTPPLPRCLANEGFVQLSAAYFEGRSPSSPETAWRTGLTLVDVHAGRAVDRIHETDEGQRRLADELHARLQDGDDCVLLGPPGVGKSTVCKQVACEWHDRENGAVLYRERGEGGPFDSPSRLEAHLRRADGHPLVVVEDIVRADASDVFETMSALRGRDVSFLFDARTSEWQKARETGGSPSLDAPWAPVEPLRMPALSAAECEAFIEQFESDFGTRVEATGTDLLAGVRGQADDTADARPGECLLVHHRLAERAVTGRDGEDSTTVLGSEAREVCAALVEADSGAALDVAVLTTLHEAAGLPTGGGLLWSLVGEWTPDELDAAVASLEGRLLFDADAADYRTRHELWATTFLEQLLEVAGETAARRRFERCVNALLSLADDGERRRQVASTVDRPTPNLNQIDHHPTTWADETVRRVFRVGIRTPALATLFGETPTSGIEIPAACSPEIRVHQAFWRGRMRHIRIEIEPTVAEYEEAHRLADATEGFDADAATALKARTLADRSDLLSGAGQYDTAIDHATRAIELGERIGDSALLAEVYLRLAITRGRRGDIRAAREALQQSQEHAREAGDDSTAAHVTCLFGTANLEEGDLREARQLYEEALELATETGNLEAVGNAAIGLTRTAILRSNFERAIQYVERCRDVTRRAPVDYTTNALWSLGLVACLRGNLDEAVDYAERGLRRARADDEVYGIVHLNRLRARVERYRGHFDAASEYAEQARTTAEEADSRFLLVRAKLTRAAVALEAGEEQTAHEQLTSIRSSQDEFARPRLEASCQLLSARLAYRAGDDRRALDLLDEITGAFREMSFPRRVAECHRLRAAVAADRGRLAAASEHAGDALEVARDSEVAYVVGRVAETAGAVDGERGELRSSLAHYRRAAAVFDRLDNTDRTATVLAEMADVCAAAGDEQAATRWRRRAARSGGEHVV